MKKCPSCRRVYTDETLSFCLEDGTPLVVQAAPVITQRFVPPDTERFEQPRQNAAPVHEFPIGSPVNQATRRSRKIWIVPVALVLLLFIAGGSIAAILLLKNKSNDSPASNVRKAVSNAVVSNSNKTNGAVISNNSATDNRVANVPSSNWSTRNVNAAEQDATPEETEFTSDTLVGTWETDVVEQGVKTHITYTLAADGTSKMFFKSNGRTGNDRGTWRFSDNILNERFADGTSAKGSIRMIDEDTFEITIIDNGVPAYKGVKRVYRRRK